MTLTDTFDLAVLTHSDTATRLKIPNVPSEEEKANLRKLYDNLLLPLVKAMPGELSVTVAYRCHKLNAKIGGKPNSQHTKGQAADLEYRENGVEMNHKIIEKVRELGLEFDQCINERNGAWIHLSYNEGKNRNQYFKL